MAAEQAKSGDYSEAKANFRDTIKWLAGALASLAAVVMAGTSFSGIGSLPFLSTQFAVAALSLILGFALVALALYKTVMLLRTDDMFASQLAAPSQPSTSPTSAEREIQEIRTYIALHRAELLPANYQSVESLLEAAESERGHMKNAIEAQDMHAFEVHKGRFAEIDVHIERVLEFAVYKRLHFRMTHGLRWVFCLALAALSFLLVFATAVRPAEKAEPSKSTIFLTTPCNAMCTDTSKTVTLAPVRFETGKAKIDEEGLKATTAAREYLIANTDSVVLLRAHTDTVASTPLNLELARRRGQAVRDLLLGAGGIAAGRIFTAELAEGDLVNLTGQESASQLNRTVEFVIAHPALGKDR